MNWQIDADRKGQSRHAGKLERHRDQDAEVRDRTVNVPDLFSTGEKSSKIGRAMTGKFVYRDDAPSFDSTTTYKWTLR